MAPPAGKDCTDTSPRNLGRYRLYGELAAGGMATVHLGRQIGSGGFSKLVAIKRLHPQFGKREEFVEMFLAEARLAARIRHPNVVQPLDVLRVEDEVFLVMEYVEGDSLSRLMKATIARQEKVPLPVAVAILSGVLRGLHAAHEAKNDKGEALELVHRDVSPQNVLVGVDGTPRVIDFGIAKAADSVQVTREGELKGKLAYIAPEILSGQRSTRRADIYAAAVVLWEVLTAQRLFDADYQSAIVANILHRPVDPPSDLVPDLPRALDQVVMKGLARDPSDRYATGREMAVALEEAFPAASAAAVGEWVEGVAAASLQRRGTRVSQIEALPSDDDDGAEPEEVLSELMILSSETADVARPPGAPPLTAASKPRASLPPVAPPPARAPASAIPPPVPTTRGIAPPPPPAAPLTRTLPPPAPTATPAGAPPAPPPPPPPRAAQPPAPDPSPAGGAPAFATPPPTVVIAEDVEPTRGDRVTPVWDMPRSVTSRPHPVSRVQPLHLGPKNRSSGGGIVVFILVSALVVALVYIGLPEFFKRSYVAAAAEQGVTLTIDSVEVGFRHVRVLGLTATMADLPGVTAHAKSLEVWFSYRLDPTDAAAHELLLSIDGTESALVDSLARVAKAHDFSALRKGTIHQFALDAGHVIWSRALGEGTRIEAESIAVEAERSGEDALGDDVTFVSPIVSMTATWGKLGPWAVNAQVDHGLAKIALKLDPSGASKAVANVVVDHGTVTTFDLTAPRSNVSQLGVGSALLGRRPEQPLYAEGEAHYAVRSASRIEGSVRMSLSGARLTNALSGADAQLEAHLAGDPAGPIELTKGMFSFGPFRGTLSGPVTVGDGYLRADVTFRTGSTRCPGGADVALGGGIAFDTRNLGDAHLGVTPSGRCAMKELPP